MTSRRVFIDFLHRCMPGKVWVFHPPENLNDVPGAHKIASEKPHLIQTLASRRRLQIQSSRTRYILAHLPPTYVIASKEDTAMVELGIVFPNSSQPGTAKTFLRASPFIRFGDAVPYSDAGVGSATDSIGNFWTLRVHGDCSHHGLQSAPHPDSRVHSALVVVDSRVRPTQSTW